MSSRLEALQQLIKEDAQDPFLRYALCLELDKANRRAEAMIQLENLQNAHPGYLALYYQWALWLMDANEMEKAKKATAMGIAVASEQNNLKTKSELQSLQDQISI